MHPGMLSGILPGQPESDSSAFAQLERLHPDLNLIKFPGAAPVSYLIVPELMSAVVD